MAQKFRKIAIMGNHRDSRVIDTMAPLATALIERGLEVFASQDVQTGSLPDEVLRGPEMELPAQAELVIAIGGDGSMLYAAKRIAGHGVPLLGINRGRLGFLADLGPDEMIAGVDAILAGDYVSERRMLLEASVQHEGSKPKQGLALNDVVIKRVGTGRMLEFQTWVDERYVNTHGCDGFIVSTPTGSTAYALSCGGPIVQPGLDAIVLAPICPHTLSDRPVVIPGASSTSVSIGEAASGVAEVSCDGEPLAELSPGGRVEVRAAGARIELIHPPGYDYYTILRNKLHWGRDSRGRRPA